MILKARSESQICDNSQRHLKTPSLTRIVRLVSILPD